ncbi:hypothetical protein [Methanobrevibacter sp.]|uniref:hypothetical protein n=1 Tax=Methanobrevibacter sp. TaxID=66852 RepID=UPI0025FE45BD|nr:hypothetical protein [Methanobrevibacter sp.]MBQ2666125.1 hypothetical protein [Methanobrevibacter sp.]
MSEKSPTIAVLWSFLFTGIGLVYLGDKTKGIMFFAIGVLFNILGMFIIGFFHYFSILTWILGIYITYKDSKKIKPKPAKYQYTRRVRHYDRGNDGYRYDDGYL